MGFSRDVNAILEHLPHTGRQTLLFSATQTKSVKDLARLSLQRPEYVSVDEKAPARTPEALAQYAVVVDLQDKLDCLASFIRTHATCKTIVFLQSCKQVRFVYESFRKVQPPIAALPFLHLHGK
jgi:ATP-dependent RNA helicase DDX10/DBP4